MPSKKPKVYVVPIPDRNTEVTELRKTIGEIGCEIVGAKEPIEKYEDCVARADVVVILICDESAENSTVAEIIKLATKLGKRIIGVWATDGDKANLPGGFGLHAEGLIPFKTAQIKQCILGEKPEWQDPDGSPQPKKKTPRHHC